MQRQQKAKARNMEEEGQEKTKEAEEVFPQGSTRQLENNVKNVKEKKVCNDEKKIQQNQVIQGRFIEKNIP